MRKTNRIEPLQLLGWGVVAFGLYIWVPVLVGEPEMTPGAAESRKTETSMTDQRRPVVFAPVAPTSDEAPVQQSFLGQNPVN